MITTTQRVLIPLSATLISGLANGGETVLVLPGEELATNDVMVNGT